jgi:hypothetical protein
MFKKNIQISFLFVIIASTRLFSQGYGMAVGIRVGNSFGLTAKQQIALRATAEFIVENNISDKSTTVSILAMRHVNIISRVGNFYIGGGVHRIWAENDAQQNGISGIGGFEFNFKKFNLSADYKPQINFSGNKFNSQVGISLRYIIFDRPFKNDNWKFWKNWKK